MVLRAFRFFRASSAFLTASSTSSCFSPLRGTRRLTAPPFLLRRQLALLFTTDEEIILGVTLSFYVVIVGMLPQNGRVVYSGCLRGAGDTRYVAMVALVSVAVLRPILTWLFCYPLHTALPGWQIAVMGPWIAFDIDAFVRNWLLQRRIRQGKWLDIKLA